MMVFIRKRFVMVVMMYTATRWTLHYKMCVKTTIPVHTEEFKC